LVLVVYATAPSARAQDEEVHRDLVHSDLPLFGGETTDMWPRPFFEDDSFGCVSRIAFGDWAFRPSGAPERDARWYRIHNYGVFHCWAVFSSAAERAALEGAEHEPSFFVLLGAAEVENNRVELWAVQIGARPGSDYLLLSRSPQDGLIETFSVLQTQCPRGNVRDSGALDIILTRYCAINTQADLLRLARRMVHRPPQGSLSLVEAESAAEE
jgi:hypothetical protein